MEQEFWQLVEEYQVQIPELSLACSAPIKILRIWAEEGAPDKALQDLKKFLQIEESQNDPSAHDS